MFNSPVKTRATRKIASNQTADKAKVGSSLSLSVTPAPCGDKPSEDMEATVKACVAKHLSSDAIFEKLADKLIGRIEKAVKEAVDISIKKFTDQIEALREEVLELRGKLNEVESSKFRFDDLEQYQRRNNIRVFGVPEKKGEDTDELVVRIFSEKLGVDVRVDRLDRSHRVGSAPKPHLDGTPRYRPLIVRFTSYMDRRRVFSAKKKLKGSGIVIREDLTRSRLDLLKRAAEMFGRDKVWTLDGRVLWLDGDGKKGMATTMADLPR